MYKGATQRPRQFVPKHEYDRSRHKIELDILSPPLMSTLFNAKFLTLLLLSNVENIPTLCSPVLSVWRLLILWFPPSNEPEYGFVSPPIGLNSFLDSS
jgi:hypothetical protein